MQGAIVCFSMQKCAFARWKRLFVEQQALPAGGGNIYIYTLPYTEEQFLHLKPERQKKIIDRCAQQLEKRGVACVYPEQTLYSFFRGNFYIPDGRRIFFAYAGQIIERHIRAFSLSTDDAEVFIYETPFTATGEAAAAAMAMYTKQLYLVSGDAAGAQRAAKSLFANYGLAAVVTDREKLMNKADIALLLSPPSSEVLSSGLILDYSGIYPYRARRDLQFETAFGFVGLLKYFGRADCRSAEFILCCYGLEMDANLDGALREIGWRVRCV